MNANRMKINVKLFFMWISCTITIAVEQQIITDPCPSYAPNTSIANMCHSGLWKEDDHMGEHRLDSVAIRITTRQKNCVCQVYLHNQNDTNELIMQKYDGRTMAAPKNSDCGLTINISLSSAAGRTNYLTPVECNKGTSFRPITLKENEKLNFKSALNEGNFESGYCLQIVRKNAKKEYDPALHVACSQITTNRTSNKQTITEDALSEQYVIIGAFTGAIVFVITLAVVFVLIRIYRKRNNDRVTGSNYKQPTQMKSDNDVSDSYGLKHTILYQTSDQCDTADGNYHTVEVGERQEVNNAQNIDGDYISIDENVSSNSKYKSEPGIQPKCKTQITKEVLGYKVEHVTPCTGNNVEYAVVNKRDRLGENTEPATSLNNEYAVVDKSGRLNKHIKHVTPKTGAL